MNRDIRRKELRAALRIFVALAGVLMIGWCCGDSGSACAQDDDSARADESTSSTAKQPEQWDTLDVELPGPRPGTAPGAPGNPFVDVQLTATFDLDGQKQQVTGFYDGDGMYRVRFMPERLGHWRYKTHSNVPQLDGRHGEFQVVSATAGNHGPVRVRNTFHFAYADGTPYRELGTTCYAWIHQGDELEAETLKTLAAAPFNKLRMCVFPKRYQWNMDEPPRYPYEGTPPNHWDFTRFNPDFFRHLEKRVMQLRDLGIEADIILFHPYDEGHWGFDRMPADADDRYLRYVVSRLAAFRNVWWSLANEYDFMTEKKESDWDRFLQIVASSDPYHHLRSIHNGRQIYNHTNPLITHASIQNGSAAEDAGRAVLYRDVYRKPVVFDEMKYEGNIPMRWGNLSAQEMVHRFWECIVAGTYPGHGECYLNPHDVLWWSKGGVLHGQSPARIAFLRDVLATSPPDGLEPIDKWQQTNIAGQAGQYYLVYFGKEPLDSWKFSLPRYELRDGMRFHVDVLDTWEMTITPVDEPFTVRQESQYVFVDQDNRSVDLPGRPWIALRITRVEDE
jgi:Domain of unknown function (DUF5060)/Protein of unknown function (DUF4038)/Domain of unknown function (DUF5605)